MDVHFINLDHSRPLFSLFLIFSKHFTENKNCPWLNSNCGSLLLVATSVTRKKSPNVYKSCPTMISLEKWMILTPLLKMPYNVGDFGKIIVATSFELLPKVQKIAQCGHTALSWCCGLYVRFRPLISQHVF